MDSIDHRASPLANLGYLLQVVRQVLLDPLCGPGSLFVFILYMVQINYIKIVCVDVDKMPHLDVTSCFQ